MLAVILFVIVFLFVFAVMPPKTKNGIRPLNIEFIMFLSGVALIYIALRTDSEKAITENKFVRTIIKIIMTIAGIAIIAFSYRLN